MIITTLLIEFVDNKISNYSYLNNHLKINIFLYCTLSVLLKKKTKKSNTNSVLFTIFVQ